MFRFLRFTIPALGLITLLSGCVAYPAYNSGYYYGAPAPYYAGPPVAVGGGWGWGGGGGRGHDKHHRRGDW